MAGDGRSGARRGHAMGVPWSVGGLLSRRSDSLSGPGFCPGLQGSTYVDRLRLGLAAPGRFRVRRLRWPTDGRSPGGISPGGRTGGAGAAPPRFACWPRPSRWCVRCRGRAGPAEDGPSRPQCRGRARRAPRQRRALEFGRGQLSRGEAARTAAAKVSMESTTTSAPASASWLRRSGRLA